MGSWEKWGAEVEEEAGFRGDALDAGEPCGEDAFSRTGLGFRGGFARFSHNVAGNSRYGCN